MPTEVERAALDAFDKYRRDVPVADLVYDSLLRTSTDDGGVRTLRFFGESALFTVEIDDSDANSRRLLLRLPWCTTAEVIVTCGDWKQTVSTDDDGTARV